MAIIKIEYEIDDEEIQTLADSILGRELDESEIEEFAEELKKIAIDAIEDTQNACDIIEDLLPEEDEEEITGGEEGEEDERRDEEED